MKIIQSNCILRQRHHRTGSFTASPERPRGIPCRPALIDLTEILSDLFRQPNPFSNPLSNLAVARQDRDVHLRPLGKAALHRRGQFLG